jgi:fluoride exporter
MQTLLIAIGGAAGALARYNLGGWVQNRLGSGFPWGTMVVNASGALLLGIVMQATARMPGGGQWRALLAIGFCGAYTTFSTFSYETARQLQDRQWLLAAANSAGNLVLSLLAVFAGFAISAWFFGSARG